MCLKDSATAGAAAAEAPVPTEVTKLTEAPVSTAHAEFQAESFSVVGIFYPVDATVCTAVSY